eukprot:GHVL01032796.1.p1 GENE.GHVL01032796.1~~GHVL01032796.1.p1  ORF type:complete len:215 (+),score=43.95 GHVL01032796.1:22-666(+)
MNSVGDIKEHRWGPYRDNGGTIVGMSGDGFAAVVSDTRLSVGYSILSRNQTKVTQLTDKCVIASGGMQSEIVTLHKLLKMRVRQYEHQHRKLPSLTAIAQLVSTTLYNKRFFPFYAFNIVAGIDNNGKGGVFGYDAIGSYERSQIDAQGSGKTLVLSVLDTLQDRNMTKQQVVQFAKDAMTSVCERDIQTGDGAEVFLIDEAGVHRELIELRQD